MRSILEGDTPQLVQRLEEGLILDSVRIEPAPVRELVEPGLPLFPVLPLLLSGELLGFS